MEVRADTASAELPASAPREGVCAAEAPEAASLSLRVAFLASARTERVLRRRVGRRTATYEGVACGPWTTRAPTQFGRRSMSEQCRCDFDNACPWSLRSGCGLNDPSTSSRKPASGLPAYPLLTTAIETSLSLHVTCHSCLSLLSPSCMWETNSSTSPSCSNNSSSNTCTSSLHVRHAIRPRAHPGQRSEPWATFPLA